MTHDEIIRYYDECHGDYKRAWGVERTLSMHYGYHDREHSDRDAAVLNMNRVLAQFAGVRPGDHVVDAGCGFGGSSIWLARNRDVDVTGINVQPMQVEHARASALAAGVGDRVRFEIADYAKTPLADDVADVVWAIESVCHAADKRAFVTEAARLLRPGGRIAIADGMLERDPSGRGEARRMSRFLEGWALPGLVTCDDFRGYLEESGFVDIQFSDITTAVMPSARRLRFLSHLSAPLTRYREWTGRRSPHEFRNRRSAINQHHTLKAGIWRYWMITAVRTGDDATT